MRDIPTEGARNTAGSFVFAYYPGFSRVVPGYFASFPRVNSKLDGVHVDVGAIFKIGIACIQEKGRGIVTANSQEIESTWDSIPTWSKGALSHKDCKKGERFVFTPKEVFEKVREAALASTGPDERALQIDYSALEERIRLALGNRKVELFHLNQFLPEGYEDQGHFNLLVFTNGKVLFDMVFGDQYFRYDIFSAQDLDKIQVIDGVWDNKEKRQEEPFLSLRLMHGDEAHIMLALNEEQRKSLLTLTDAISSSRHPEQ